MGEIELRIESRVREIEPGFTVGRVLPAAERRSVGPFLFLDQMGPRSFPAGGGADIRPHPHIGLATVTYLYEGAAWHRDSLGSDQVIRPGAVNWMSAGSGIAHSERTPPEVRAAGGRMHGLQLWVGLPKSAEESEPWFRHYPAESFPDLKEDGVALRVLAGEAYGVKAKVTLPSPALQVDATMPAGSRLRLPGGYSERSVYVVKGRVSLGSEQFPAGTMAVFRPGGAPVLVAEETSRVMVLGGEPLDGPRFMFWNFVHSSKERIVDAANAWKEGRFAKVKGDEQEFVPLTMEPRFSSRQ